MIVQELAEVTATLVVKVTVVWDARMAVITIAKDPVCKAVLLVH